MFAENVKLQTHFNHIRTNHQDRAVRRRLVFNGIGLLLYLLSMAYLGWHGWALFSGLLPASLYVLLLSFASLVAPAVAMTFDQGQSKEHHLKSMAYLGFYWLGFYLYAMILLVSSDLIRFLGRVLGWQALWAERGIFFWPERRFVVAAIFWLSLSFLLAGTYLARAPRLRQIPLTLTKPLSQPLRIAFVSDLHVGSLVSTANIPNLVQKINEQKPDLILLGGDLIDNALTLIDDQAFIVPMRRLKAKLGIYAVLGNHELVNTTPQAMQAFLQCAGIKLLCDEKVEFADLTLIGRDEYQTHYSAKLDRMLPEDIISEAKPAKPVVLMQHQPQELTDWADLGIDLALAGHTHRGQMFPLNLLQKKHYAQTKPFAQTKGMQSFISAGYGTWGPPVRLGSRSEILILDLNGPE